MYSWDEVLKMGDALPDEDLQERAESLDFDDPININIRPEPPAFPRAWF